MIEKPTQKPAIILTLHGITGNLFCEPLLYFKCTPGTARYLRGDEEIQCYHGKHDDRLVRK